MGLTEVLIKEGEDDGAEVLGEFLFAPGLEGEGVADVVEEVELMGDMMLLENAGKLLGLEVVHGGVGAAVKDEGGG